MGGAAESMLDFKIIEWVEAISKWQKVSTTSIYRKCMTTENINDVGFLLIPNLVYRNQWRSTGKSC